jgi:hypothetical protein
MARNKTLGSILDLYRSHAKLSGNPAHHAQLRDSQVRLLASFYETLHAAHDWPHLNIEREYALQAGQRLWDFAPDFDLDRIRRIYVKEGGDWVPLRPAVTQCDYASYDSALGERSWPVVAWRIWEGEKIEVWPIPDQNGDAATHNGYLKVEGVKARGPFFDDTHVCLLDDLMIALFAAAETLSDPRARQEKRLQAEARKQQLLGNLHKARSTQLFVQPAPAPRARDFPTYKVGDAT